MPAKHRPTWRNVAVLGRAWPRTNASRARELRVVDDLGHATATGGDAGVGGAELGDPVVAVAAANAARKSARISSCTASSVWCVGPLLETERAAEVGEELGLDRADRDATCRRAQG